MLFKVVEQRAILTEKLIDYVILEYDRWNDYGFRTLFAISYIANNGERHNLGEVKIAFKGQTSKDLSLSVNSEFETLNIDFFSLGGKFRLL